MKRVSCSVLLACSLQVSDAHAWNLSAVASSIFSSDSAWMALAGLVVMVAIAIRRSR